MADLSVLRRAVPGEGVAIEESEAYLELTAATKTLDGTHSGYLLLCTRPADGSMVITLPAVSTTYVGCRYRIVNASPDGTITLSVTGATTETIQGIGATTGQQVIHTKATSKYGDMIELSSGSATGWHIVRQIGTWAQAAD